MKISKKFIKNKLLFPNCFFSRWTKIHKLFQPKVLPLIILKKMLHFRLNWHLNKTLLHENTLIKQIKKKNENKRNELLLLSESHSHVVLDRDEIPTVILPFTGYVYKVNCARGVDRAFNLPKKVALHRALSLLEVNSRGSLRRPIGPWHWQSALRKSECDRVSSPRRAIAGRRCAQRGNSTVFRFAPRMKTWHR